MTFEHKTVRLTGMVSAALMLALVAPSSALAKPDPGGPAVIAPAEGIYCPLTRIDEQLVRCDNLTGAGTKAPSWIPEQ